MRFFDIHDLFYASIYQTKNCIMYKAIFYIIFAITILNINYQVKDEKIL